MTATLPLPKIPRMQATDGKVWHMKLPLYVNLDSRPYDGDYYKELEREEETIDGKAEPKLAKQKILTVKNTIRWKWTSGTDGKPVRKASQGCGAVLMIDRRQQFSDGAMVGRLNVVAARRGLVRREAFVGHDACPARRPGARERRRQGRGRQPGDHVPLCTVPA